MYHDYHNEKIRDYLHFLEVLYGIIHEITLTSYIYLCFRVPARSMILARIELLNFAEEGESEAMLSMDSKERNKTYTFEDVLKVVQKEHRTGNSYFGKDEYKSAAKW